MRLRCGRAGGATTYTGLMHVIIALMHLLVHGYMSGYKRAGNEKQ